MNATTKQPQQSRAAIMAKCRRDSQTMSVISTLAQAACDFNRAHYDVAPAQSATRLDATFREIAALLPKRTTRSPNRRRIYNG